MEQTILTAQAPRAALMKLLDGLLERRFIYIHAPAGFGKTTASLLWLEHRENLGGMKRAWVNLDEYDNKTSEFCRRFVLALANLQPENTALKELAAHQVFNTAPIDFTLHALSAFAEEPDEIVLVLDDLHIIHNDEILKLMMVLFKRLPDNFTILLLSRAVPPGSFSEMVAKEELAVVDARYLQFTGGEIKVFFDKNGRTITTNQADEILASTGGWAIGIRALLMSEEKSYNIDLTGRYLEGFLKEHVWERWDDRLRSFMVLVSVADELTPEICECLTADEKSLKNESDAQILSELVSENAFLHKTGSNTYRFHELFRNFLIHMLEECDKKTALKQWNKMGDHFFNLKEYHRSVKYYTAGRNDKKAAQSLYFLYDYDSRYSSIESTLDIIYTSITDSYVERFPFLIEIQVRAAFAEGRAEDLESLLDRFYNQSPTVFLKNPRLFITMGLMHCIDYRKDFVRILKTLKRIPFKNAVQISSPNITCNMPLFHRSSRDFSDITLNLDQNLRLLENGFGSFFKDKLPIMCECIHAGFSYEQGDMNAALEHAVKACSNINSECSPEIKLCAMMILCMTFLAVNQNKESVEVIENIKAMIKNDGAFYLNDNFNAFLFRLKLSDGDKDAASEWLKNCNQGEILSETLMFYKLYQYFTTARAYIVNGDYSNAVILLQKMLKLNERYRRPLDIIETRILLAIVYWKKGRHGQTIALDYMEKAIETAHEYGYIQVFANEGAELVNMLKKIQSRSSQSTYAGKKIPVEFVKKLCIAAATEAKRSKGLTGGRTAEKLSFTDKQKTVMRLMCEGCGRNEIAGRIGISPYGVKSHARLIYKKLDVSNGVEAVLKIKKMGLLDVKQK